MNIRNDIYLTNATIMHSSTLRLLCILLLCLLPHANMSAQEPAKPKIVIGGDVYGGGLEGKVGQAPAEGQEITSDQANTEVTSVTINSGQVRTVFGGGKNGAVFGRTTVNIKGGEIGADRWEGTPYGGVYGGGEGDEAVVYGHTSVDIDGGINYNNVYGGGKQALLKGNSNVLLKSGLIHNHVFAGARMADINGYAFVDVIGNNTLDNMLIARAVYGGNDISGHILNNGNVNPFPPSVTSGLPKGLASFVRAQSSATNAFVANLFGGGNGDYNYLTGTTANTLKVNLVEEQKANDIDEVTVTFDNLPNKPEARYAYLQIEGGTYGSIYGGGNNATITNQTHIYYGINDATIKPLKGIPNSVLSWLDLYEGYKEGTVENTFDMTYNAFRIFGGNNLADMSIRPVWHLKSGTVGNIYSGGNKGKMTGPTGIVLAITSPDLKAHNVYGGCRMADVEPQGVSNIAGETYTYHSYKYPEGDNLVEKYDATYEFKPNYAARVLITDGKINNLYGGNDISGKVHFGTNVELRGAISGDVYGGGNGSYAYTDKESWVTAHPEDADYYYDPGTNSIEAMYANRPHVEKTLLHITGIGSTAPPVYVTGGVYCGGNSATLTKDGGNATATFKIGKHVVINSVFLGSNGENMIKEEILQKYADKDFSSLDLTDEETFKKYMNAVAVNLKPTIDWEWDDNTEVPGMNGAGVINATEAYIGAFYCGGNVGSMTTSEQMLMNFPKGLTIFDRIVGGCNSAKIIAQDGLNALHEGGVTTAMSDGSPKVVLNVHSRLEPRKMVLTYADGDTEKLFYETASTAINTEEYQYGTNNYSLLKGANVYGGCYESGHINGDVVININRDIVSPAIPEANMNLNNPEFLVDAGITGTVPFAQYVFSRAMNIFGGGYGANTEIKGKTTINLTDNARVMKVFGGGEMGVVSGKDNGDGTRTGSVINISADKPLDEAKYNAYMAYGGGYEGLVNGDVTVNLNSGRLYDVYGGSCNADIDGTTLVKIGNGTANVLEVKNSVFGANDFGGQLLQTKKWAIDDGNKTVRSQSHVQYLSGKIDNEVFGGAFGSYNYNKFTKAGFKFPKQNNVVDKGTDDPDDIILANTFVQVASQSATPADYVKGAIYGGGRGYANASGIVDVKQSYVHLAASPIRTTALVPTVFGGGYYSYVENTLVNAYSGKVGTIYGGTAGMSAENLADTISYNAGTTVVNLHSMENPNMNVFGAGALAGAATTHVNLYGGQAANIYGGSFEEGICQTTNVNVPENSTVAVKSLYGGSKGKSAILPCDVETANIIVASDKAYVSDTIFGGNHAYRAVEKTNIDIQVPVRMEPGGTLVNVYGGGNGSATITGSTHVKLSGNAQLLDVYGGGKSGKVLDAYDGGALADRVKAYYASLSSLSSNSRYLGNPTWGDGAYEHNTHVELLGGELRNVYAGGYAGNVEGDTYLEIGGKTMNAPTHAEGNPTIRRSAYGGGEMAKVTGTAKVDMWNGHVGYYYDDAATDKYVKELDLRKEGDNLLKENGNLYGAGYGVGAVVMKTQVNLYDGVIRNGLYGGAEIATVGEGSVKLENNKYVLDQYIKGGETKVRMYGGLVEGDVFGGGRGFSYDLTGNVIEDMITYTSGYVFGKTDVEIYRGTVGTDESLAEGHGNVFGGGNIGYVYGGSENSPSTIDPRTNSTTFGHYYENDSYSTRTEDCHVSIIAMCKAKKVVTVNNKEYNKGEFVTNEDLNALASNSGTWNDLDSDGITIRNAVFAGGNVSSGSDKIYANAVTVYGNATASVIDVFAKDFIRLGGEHVGGLYGDGNLTFVDGYRELNITNYGTDYYNLLETLSYDDYLKLTDREKDYYTLMYKLKEGDPIDFDYNGVIYNYTFNSEHPTEITDNVYRAMLNAWVAKNLASIVPGLSFEYNEKSYTYIEGMDPSAYEELKTAYAAYRQFELESKWEVKGVCAITAGRMMNTIQRADFCGVFGSRMVLHGAQDRVPDVVDYTNYTINRVDEVSLNQRNADYDAKVIHGNYFGIYNIVNELYAFTSDVKFDSPRVAEEQHDSNYGTTTYKEFKNHNLNNRVRNNGTSENMVALASGAYLELSRTDKNGNKEYGPVTGVIQLDMINVQPGEGGGYVYAKNEHRTSAFDQDQNAHLVLSTANTGAVTHLAYSYDGNTSLMQTSGNFVHPQKRIVDDCFPRGGYYTPGEENYSPAHYWYIRGSFYVYDQYLSAYTGAADAYPQTVNIPLTITAGSNGTMELVDVNPNKYAYFKDKHYKNKILSASDSILVGTTTYHMNDPISYFEWSQLSITDQSYFVDETYVAVCDAMVGNIEYKKGDVFLPEEYNNLIAQNEGKCTIKDINGEYKVGDILYTAKSDSVFRISNEISHKEGYLLTFDITNPLKWDDYYTKHNHEEGTLQSVLGSELANKDGYKLAPTLLCTQTGIYGQRQYALNDIVNQKVIDDNETLKNDHSEAYNQLQNQATFEPAYIVVDDEISFNYGGMDYHMYKNSYMAESMRKNTASIHRNTEPAYVCTNTIEIADKEYILQGDLISTSMLDEIKAEIAAGNNEFLKNPNGTPIDTTDYFSKAYVCTAEKGGGYGGTYFEEKKNYPALDFCALSDNERNAVGRFKFNYDALDLLVTDFAPDMSKYDGDRGASDRIYSVPQPVNYSAKYIGENENNNNETYSYRIRKYTNGNYTGETVVNEIEEGAMLNREDYELILNEKAHFVPLNIPVDGTYYIVKTEYEKANIYNPVGKLISEDDYNLLEQKEGYIDVKELTQGTHYYCVEDFVLSLQTPKEGELQGKTELVKGTIINGTTFEKLLNDQQNFIISGHSPVETSTLYVPRESDILNLSQDRVISVVYKYTYKEGSADGSGYETFVEKHVVNIHIQFKSGQPSIGDVNPPATVLPNSTVGLSVPSVKKGAYEILGGGWEMFETEKDALEHKNGIAYQNNATPMYWYQNNYYVAYYAKTYLGKAYSNPVPFSVANYHRMGEVMHHPKRMFIDHKDVDRASKIYLDAADYDANSIAAGEKENNDLDFLYDLYMETNAGETSATEPYTFNERIKNAANLDFILRSDIAPKKYTAWQQPGADGACFAGNFHGNGHTVSGLNKSLFHNLCGTVYNTGVTGSFTGGGVADNGGKAVNCWVKTSDTSTSKTYAVIGNAAKDAADVKVINSYYHSDNGFKSEGMATPRPETDFVKGHVAYDLNRYYLEARRGVKDVNEDKKFMFYMRQPNGQLEMADGTGAPELWTSYYHTDNVLDKYVEDNIKTGDFIYANGEIPLEADVRMKKESGVHYPIYPDDYLFFGQSLNYTPSHDNVPEALIKNEDNLVVHNNETANRIYRAPAYRKSSSLNQVNPAVYFNRHAAFAGTHDSKSVDADLTAIDFTGASEKETGEVKTAVVYTPLLDYEGLKSFDVTGITQNLLVYADAKDVASHDVLSASLLEPAYSANTNYWNEVDIVPAQEVANVKGHLVVKGDKGYVSNRNHFLVDKQDFNAPLAYTFDGGHFMWYQRTPEVFIDGTGGWEGLCLPFTAKMVSAHQKGEITHFYGKDDNKAHEYWLRAPKEVQTKDENTHMIFERPKTGETGKYVVGNSFLYNYYYSNVDDNGDSYWNSEFNQSPNGNRESDNHGNYYAGSRTYVDYVYLTANVPYIIGFPGVRYYEFDMSGQFAPDISDLDNQTISYVSGKGANIPVSDENNMKTAVGGYTYTGAFIGQDITNGYVLNNAGCAFEPATSVVPFRTYISKAPQPAPKRIHIGYQQEGASPEKDMLHNLYIRGGKGAIHIESTLEVETKVTIHTLSGVLVKELYVLPGAKVNVPVQHQGVYIVNRRKVSVN